MKKQDGWSEVLTASLISAQPETALMQKYVQALFDNVTIVPVSYGTALWATTDWTRRPGAAGICQLPERLVKPIAT
jgi:hypothetical protein